MLLIEARTPERLRRDYPVVRVNGKLIKVPDRNEWLALPPARRGDIVQALRGVGPNELVKRYGQDAVDAWVDLGAALTLNQGRYRR